MISRMNFAKRYVLLPAALAIIVTWTVAAPQAANPKNMIATDGMIEIEDGRHCQILARQMPFQWLPISLSKRVKTFLLQ